MKQLYFHCIVCCMVACLLATSCAVLSDLFSGISKPSIRVADTKLQDLSLEKVNLMVHLEISNPYSLPLPLSNLQYALESKGQKFLDGKADVQGTIPAQSSKIVPIPVAISFLPLLNVLQHVKPGGIVDYTAKMDLSVDAPGVGPLNLPIEQTGELPIPTVPKVELSKIQWQEMSLTKATANLHVKIENKNSFPLELSTFQYRLNLANTSVAQDQISQTTKFTENGSNVLQIPLTISPLKLGMAAFEMLQGKGANYNLDGGLQVATPFGPISFPISGNGQTEFVK